MYEFIKTETGWRIYWGPPPREEVRQQETAPGPRRETFQPKTAVTIDSEFLALAP